MDPRLSHIRDWVFDLDNTLYPAATGLFDLIDQRMTAYIERLLGVDAIEARQIQKMHFHGSGTTLAGLMAHHDVDPHHFMDDVHAIPLDRVGPNPVLAAALGRLPGRKFIYTNGNAAYAQAVLERIGIDRHFEHLHDIFEAELKPKPDAHGYRLLIDRFAIDPGSAVMVEDMAQNLRAAKALGMTTVWVDNGSERGNHDFHEDHVDLVIHDVADWLDRLTKEAA